MAKKKNQVRVSPADDWWKVQSTGSEKAYRKTSTKAEAMKIATEVAKNKKAELIIQKKDGTIQNTNSFGNDPMPPRDTK